MTTSSEQLPDLKYDANGLIAAIVQHHESGEILMLGYMDAEALRLTLEKQLVTFLEPQPLRILDEGRDQRQRPAPAQHPQGLRRRRAAGPRRSSGAPPATRGTTPASTAASTRTDARPSGR